MSNTSLEEQEDFCSSSFEHFYNHFQRLMHKAGIRYSSKRESLLRALFLCDTYLSAEQIQAKLHDESHLKISLASIYKILTFFESVDVVSVVINYPNKMKKYKLKRAVHHDHLVCLKCGEITRFFHATIEAIQDEILDAHHFKGTHHTLTLYGVCERCQHQEEPSMFKTDNNS